MPPRREYDDAGHPSAADAELGGDNPLETALELAVSIAGAEPEPEPDPLEKVRALGNRRTAALASLVELEAELWPALAEAGTAGVPKTAIAAAAGVTRQTVYNVLASRDGA